MEGLSMIEFEALMELGLMGLTDPDEAGMEFEKLCEGLREQYQIDSQGETRKK